MSCSNETLVQGSSRAALSPGAKSACSSQAELLFIFSCTPYVSGIGVDGLVLFGRDESDWECVKSAKQCSFSAAFSTVLPHFPRMVDATLAKKAASALLKAAECVGYVKFDLHWSTTCAVLRCLEVCFLLFSFWRAETVSGSSTERARRAVSQRAPCCSCSLTGLPCQIVPITSDPITKLRENVSWFSVFGPLGIAMGLNLVSHVGIGGWSFLITSLIHQVIYVSAVYILCKDAVRVHELPSMCCLFSVLF